MISSAKKQIPPLRFGWNDKFGVGCFAVAVDAPLYYFNDAGQLLCHADLVVLEWFMELGALTEPVDSIGKPQKKKICRST
jgi:hypothetical protein